VTREDRRPKSAFRRFERAMMGALMSVFAFFLEKIVMRNLRKQGKNKPKAAPDATQITSKGGAIEFEPEL
jgi:hypothetical protein